MNKKGQALIEFVLILPLFIFLIMVIYDFGMIFTTKNRLENISGDVIDLYKNGKALEEIENVYKNVSISIEPVDNYEYNQVSVSYKQKLITPGFNRVFGNPYLIKVERYVYD